MGLQRAGPIKKAECQQIDALNCGSREDSGESLRLQGGQTINFKGNQHRLFIRRTDAEAEAPILWLSDELTHWTRH